MHSVSTRVLSLAGEAALLVRGGRIVYANARAEKLLGGELVGKPLTALFSGEITEAQARVFLGELFHDVGRAVGGAVVDADDLDLREVLREHREQRVDERGLAVVHGDDHADVGCGLVRGDVGRGLAVRSVFPAHR